MVEVTRVIDPGCGRWIADRTIAFPQGAGVAVGSVVPSGFEAVVRVLHPAGDPARTWAQIAAAAGRKVHPLAQWACVAPHLDGRSRSGDVDPEEGSCPAETLTAILKHCQGEDEVFHAVWDGFGIWDRDGIDLRPETLLEGSWGRSYLVFRGPKSPIRTWPGMTQACPFGQSANLIWPSDRSWCVATEIDWDHTLIAGTRLMVQAILADPGLEAFVVNYQDDLSWCGDTINPRPPWLTELCTPL